MLERIEYEAFITLAEELHFGRTARRLVVSTGRVSQVVKRLERRVGAPLFERTSRSVRLTALGRELHATLRPAYDDITQALRRATDQGRSATDHGRSATDQSRCAGGRLRAGFTSQWCGDLLLTAGARAKNRLPGVDVRVVEIDHRDRLDALRAGAVDAQLTELPVADPDVVVGPVVISDRRALAVPSGHRLAGLPAVVLEDLAGERLVTVGDPADCAAHDFHYPRRTPSGRPIGRGPVAATWQDALVHVGAGAGVSPASIRAAAYHARPGVAYVPIIDAPPVDYALMWLRANDHVRMRAFSRLVAEVAAGEEAAVRQPVERVRVAAA